MENGKQQTAVEQFWMEIKSLIPPVDPATTYLMINALKKAEKMEKEKLILAHINGQSEFDKGAYRQEVINNAEQYYNETFKQQEQ